MKPIRLADAMDYFGILDIPNYDDGLQVIIEGVQYGSIVTPSDEALAAIDPIAKVEFDAD